MRGALGLLLITTATFLYAVDFDFDRPLERFDERKTIGGSAGFSHEYDDELFGVSLFGDFRWEPAGFGFLVPLRWLVYDKNDDTDTVMGMPTYDWDEVRDYVRLVTSAYYGHPGDEVYLYFGPHENRYLGHGTLLGGYFNEIRLDRPSRGIYALLQTDWAGGELFTNDVTPPEVVGGRVSLKPWSFVEKESYLNNFELGVTWLSDIFMPEEITRDLEGDRHIDRVFDSAVGLDASFRIAAFRWWHATPYVDWNLLRFAGNGIHVGFKNCFTIPLPDDEIHLDTTLEGRVYERNYSPQYFGTFYDIEREYYAFDETKYRVHTSSLLGSGPWYTGWYGDAVLHITGLFAIGGSFEWNEYLDIEAGGVRKGRFGVNLFGDLALFERFRLSLFFTRADAGHGGFFDVTGTRSLLSALLSFRISDYMSVSARLGNGYRLDRMVGTHGAYRSELLFGLGFAASYGF